MKTLSRKGRIAVEGSPPFQFLSPAIAASTTWLINFRSNTTHGARMWKYAPFNFVEIINNQAEDVTLSINGLGGIEILVRGNTAKKYTERPIEAVAITNRSAVNAIGAATIEVLIERLPATADSEANRKLAGSVR